MALLLFSSVSTLPLTRNTTPWHRNASPRRQSNYSVVRCTAVSETESKAHNVVIVGSGPAGYTAALYTGRAKLRPIVLEGISSGTPGGQLMTTHIVENYPGLKEITGPELMANMREQAEMWGSQMIADDCISIDTSTKPYKVHTASSGVLQTNSIIIATGASAKRLGVPGEHDLWSRGISACAICDGSAPVFNGVPLAVVGGGDSACEEAVYLTKYSSEVHLLVRGSELRASKVLASRCISHSKIHVHYNTSVVEALSGAGSGMNGLGGSPLRGIKVVKNGETSEMKVRGLFYAIGHTPNTRFLQGSRIELTGDGLVATRIPGLPETSVEGVFVAGDVADSLWRQAVTAAGSGCQAAIATERWLAENGLETIHDSIVENRTTKRSKEDDALVAANESTFNEDLVRHRGQYALRKLYHSSKRPLIVKFISPGCGPCGILRPIIDSVVKEFENEGQVHFVEIDIVQDQDIAEDAGVTGTPTIMIFHEKSLIDTFRGVKGKSVYRTAIKSILQGAAVGGR